MHKALISVMKNFERQNGDLLVGGQRVRDVLQDYSVPLYIYDRSVLKKRHAELRKHLPKDLHIDYAIKANPNVDVLKLCAPLYDGFDVASIGEMKSVMAAGIAPERMSFAGPGKSVRELTEAIIKGMGTISVESEREVEHIASIAKSINKKVDVLVRINPAFELSKSGIKMGGGAKQFGIDSERVPALIHKYQENEWVNICGIHIYAGSQNLSAEAIVSTYEKIINYATELVRDTSIDLKILNLGGGFGIPYFQMDEPLDLAALGSGISELLAKAKNLLPTTQFKIELGRYIVGECGLYATRVLYRKISRDQTFVIINGGMHHHLAASGNFGQKLVHRPMPMTIANALNNPLEKVNIVGPLCTPLDTFGLNVEIPHADEDDVLVV